MKSGDVIVFYDGKKVEKTTQLQKYVAETKIGRRVNIQIYRDGKKLTKRAKIVLLPKNLGSIKIESGLENYGIQLSPIDKQLKAKLGLKESYGLYLSRLEPNGLARKNDLRVGDVILEVNRVKIRNINDFKKALKKSAKNTALILIFRNNSRIFRSLPVK